MQTSWVDLLHWTLSCLLLSLESGVDCPCPWFHANSLLLASLLSSCQLPLCCPAPTALCWVASSTPACCPAPTALLRVPSPTLIRVPLPLPDTARFHVKESFVWFRAKTDSSALAAHPHSATVSYPARVEGLGKYIIWTHQSHYHVHFQAKTLWKGMNPLIPPAMG